MIDFPTPPHARLLPHQALSASPPTRAQQRRRFRLLSIRDLRALPAPEWLIPGVLVAGELAMCYGPPASYKSFVSLGMAMAVATGTPWMGRPTKQGPVIYVAAEGAGGYTARVLAWAESAGMDSDETDRTPVHLVTEPVQLHRNDDVAGFLAEVQAKGLRPALVVFDTLSRCFAGGDENSAQTVSTLVEAIDDMRRATGAAVLLVHHSRKDGSAERGSGAFLGAVHTMIRAQRGDGTLTIHCVKMKDAAEFQPMTFRICEVGDSIVLEPTSAAPVARVLTDHERRCLDALPEREGISHGTWKAQAEGAGVPGGSFNKLRKKLLAERLVEQDAAGHYRRAGAATDGISGIDP